MKRSEAYINKLAEMFNISTVVASTIYHAINEYDWTVFCSYMGDYDHPRERVAAEEQLNSFKNSCSPEMQELIDSIQKYMDSDKEYNIHNMDREL